MIAALRLRVDEYLARLRARDPETLALTIFGASITFHTVIALGVLFALAMLIVRRA